MFKLTDSLKLTISKHTPSTDICQLNSCDHFGYQAVLHSPKQYKLTTEIANVDYMHTNCDKFYRKRLEIESVSLYINTCSPSTNHSEWMNSRWMKKYDSC